MWASEWSLNLYRNPSHRQVVLDFYTEFSGDPAIAQAILEACDSNEIPPGLAFALVATESDFNPRALGYNSRSRDYGLFQLNSKTYPDLKPEEAFDPQTNAGLGAAHIRQSLEVSQSLSEALAVYNAGPRRALSGRLPPSTREYVRKVLNLKNDLENRFLDWILAERLLAQGPKSTKAPSSLLDTSQPF